ncbi:MAG: hypothetical protein KF784_06295 [Fimbriimonadaceae bacterium]|nr:hypothetical protein [Fimbriimonadaceae bacterium]
MFTALIAFSSIAVGQTAAAVPNDMDFWVGNWECTGKSRTAPGKDEWTDTKSTNVIKKTLGGKVIEENFSMQGFNGRSWSVWSAQKKKWSQTWVDDSGGYLLFEGGKVGDTVVLQQTNVIRAGVSMRMVFSEIKKESFTWSWQMSKDEGKSWEDQWVLKYKRR